VHLFVLCKAAVGLNVQAIIQWMMALSCEWPVTASQILVPLNPLRLRGHSNLGATSSLWQSQNTDDTAIEGPNFCFNEINYLHGFS